VNAHNRYLATGPLCPSPRPWRSYRASPWCGEHQLFGGRLPVEAEIALALELNRRLDLASRNAGSSRAPDKISSELGLRSAAKFSAPLGIRFAEQRIVDAHLAGIECSADTQCIVAFHLAAGPARCRLWSPDRRCSAAR